jgi:hypothetical protein
MLAEREPMTKLVHGLVAASCLSATPAGAFDPPFVWVGQMVLVKASDCGGGGGSTVSIVFRPKLQAGEDNSTLSYSFGFASGTARKIAPTPQFDGAGAYAGSFVTGYASTRTNKGTFDLAVRPARVTPATDFVAFTGTFTNFVGLDGCTVEVRGAASRLSG